MGNGKLSKSTRDAYLLTGVIDNFGFSILVSNILLLTADFSCELHKIRFIKIICLSTLKGTRVVSEYYVINLPHGEADRCRLSIITQRAIPVTELRNKSQIQARLSRNVSSREYG